MSKIILIGSSTPLQKILPIISMNNLIEVVKVYLDDKQDREVVKYCQSNNIDYSLMQNLKLKQEISQLKETNIDWVFNINSTLIFNDELLSLPRKGALNFHPGKLPEYAGLYTHQWAIRNGEKEFGVTLHWMNTGIDTGNIAFQHTFPIKDNDTGLTLYLKCLKEGVGIIKKAIEYIVEDKSIPSIPQDLSKRKLYTKKMALNGKINWDQSSESIINFIRAADYSPFQSPTYQPFFLYKNHKFFVTKAKKNKIILPVGDFKIIENKINVGTKDSSIILEKIYNEKAKLITPSDFEKYQKHN